MIRRRLLPLVFGLCLSIACGQVNDDTRRLRDRDGSGGSDAVDGGSTGGGTASGAARGMGGAGSGGSPGAGGSSEPDGATSAGGAASGGAASGGEDGGGAATGGEDGGGAGGDGGSESTGGAENTGGVPVEEETGTKAMRAGPTVWLGEVESTVTYPENLVGFGTPPQRVVLVLDRVETGVTGTITFGARPPPPPPTTLNESYPPDPTGAAAFADNWEFSPYDGFSYSIVSANLRGNTLVLAFVPLELFALWCELRTPPHYLCDCDDTSCWGKDGPERRLELVVSGESLRGQLSRPAGPWLGEVPALKLDRVR